MRLVLDELYSRQIAEELRDRGHDVVSLSDGPELVGIGDADLLAWATAERRAIATNNAVDFLPLMQGEDHFGLLLTSDRSLPRSRETIGLFVKVLGGFLARHPREEALRGQARCLPEARP